MTDTTTKQSTGVQFFAPQLSDQQKALLTAYSQHLSEALSRKAANRKGKATGDWSGVKSKDFRAIVDGYRLSIVDKTLDRVVFRQNLRVALQRATELHNVVAYLGMMGLKALYAEMHELGRRKGVFHKECEVEKFEGFVPTDDLQLFYVVEVLRLAEKTEVRKHGHGFDVFVNLHGKNVFVQRLHLDGAVDCSQRVLRTRMNDEFNAKAAAAVKDLLCQAEAAQQRHNAAYGELVRLEVERDAAELEFRGFRFLPSEELRKLGRERSINYRRNRKFRRTNRRERAAARQLSESMRQRFVSLRQQCHQADGRNQESLRTLFSIRWFVRQLGLDPSSHPCQFGSLGRITRC